MDALLLAFKTINYKLIISSFLLLLLASAWAFYPGLGGTLLFDDIPNLQAWADLGDLNSISKILTFVSSSQFVPGRPLSLLSFLIDDQSWPADIAGLKRTNLALHLINTSLIFWLCLMVTERLLPNKNQQARAILSLLATALWSLHPLQVSNVSYIIQRMNLLSTAIELTGLLMFFHGRKQLDSAPRKAFILCSIAIGIFTPLAILAKENGLLLCVFALLVDSVCFSSSSKKWWSIWKLSFLWAPLIVFLIYCLIIFHGFTTGFSTRNFNAWERLLTQGPVLTDYLSKLLLPRLHGSGLYFDNFPISHSLLNPISTLFCWTLLIGVLVLARANRHRQPLIAFGIFFYFGGHLLESTVIPLELYYEHRNYLPQIGIWLAIVGLLSTVKSQYFHRLILAGGITSLAFLLLLTRTNSALWSQPELQAAVWYHDNPGSVRTSLSYANSLTIQSDFIGAYEVLETARQYNPSSFALLVSQRYISCYAQDNATNFDDLAKFATQADFDTASIIMLEKMRGTTNTTANTLHKQRRCTGATDTQIADIYKGLLKNKRYLASSAHPQLLQFLAEISTSHDDPISLQYYDQAFKVVANPLYPYRQALLLEQHGYPRHALVYAATAKQALTSHYRILYPELLPRIERLQNKLEASSKRTSR